MIGIVIPTHDEQDHLGFCLQSLLRASRCPALQREQVLLVVALDRCSDASASIAHEMGALSVTLDSGKVGAARAAGARLAMDIGVRWLAFTDADCIVAPDWLAAQLAMNTDAVCGSVSLHDGGSYDDWLERPAAATTPGFEAQQIVSGANLGLSTDAYLRAGGFQPLASGDDAALVRALYQTGASVSWSDQPRVLTSARSGRRAAVDHTVAPRVPALQESASPDPAWPRGAGVGAR